MTSFPFNFLLKSLYRGGVKVATLTIVSFQKHAAGALALAVVLFRLPWCIPPAHCVPSPSLSVGADPIDFSVLIVDCFVPGTTVARRGARGGGMDVVGFESR